MFSICVLGNDFARVLLLLSHRHEFPLLWARCCKGYKNQSTQMFTGGQILPLGPLTLPAVLTVLLELIA